MGEEVPRRGSLGREVCRGRGRVLWASCLARRLLLRLSANAMTRDRGRG